MTLKGKYAETDSQIVIYTRTKLDMLKLGRVGHDNDALAKALNNRAFSSLTYHQVMMKSQVEVGVQHQRHKKVPSAVP